MKKLLFILSFIFICGNVFGATTNYCGDANVVGCYPMEGTEANALEDKSSNGYDLTNNSATYTSGYFSFDGSVDYLYNETASWSYGGDWTVFIKVDNWTDIGSSNSIFSTRSYGGSGWIAKIEQWNNTGYVGNTFRNVGDYASNISSPTGESCIFMSHDDSANTLYYYVDASSDSDSVGEVSVAAASDGLMIGGWHGGNSYSPEFQGDVLETALFSDILTSGERSDICTNGLGYTDVVSPLNSILYNATIHNATLY